MITGEGQSVSPVDGNAALASQSAEPGTPTTTGSTEPSGTGSLIGATTGGTTSPAATNSDASPWSLNEKGQFGEGWLDRLPEEFADSKQILGQFKDPAAMAKTLINQQRLLGKKADAVIVPNEKSTPEEWQAFRSKIGIPENADAYAVKPKDLPQGVEWNQQAEAQAKEFNTFAHEKGLTPAQAEALLSWDIQRGMQAAQQAEAQAKAEYENNKKALAEAWGDKFDTNMAVVKRACQVTGLDPNSKGLSDPAVVVALERFARMVSDDKIVSSDSTSTFMAGKAKGIDIIKNPQNPYHQRYMAGDQEINKLVLDLIKNG
jgi:hypothetical protein